LKHLKLLTQKPPCADGFTTGQKLTLAAGIADALSRFYAAKEFQSGETA